MSSTCDSFLTIVSGLPRSGTSMMMRMLERGGMPVLVDHVRQPDEDNPGGYYEFEVVKKTKEDPGWLMDAKGKAVKMVYRLLYDLPADQSYRVLFMRRKLEEVLASQRIMLERNGAPADDVRDEQMAKLFVSEIDAFYRWVGKQPHIQLLDVDYNRIQREPLPELDRVNKFLGARLNVESMAQAVNPSLYRNRK